MAFWIKKVLGGLLMPVPLILVALVFGVIWVIRRPNRRTGRILIATSCLALVLASNSIVSRWLIQPLEGVYTPAPDVGAGNALPPAFSQCSYIVVLGGGNGDTPGLPALSQLSPSSLGRIVEAVRLARLLPNAKLIVSGPRDANGQIHARVLCAAAESLGIAPSRIQTIENARDTYEEAQATKAIVGRDEVALVTSAWHMPRAAGLFMHRGVNIVECPADFLGKPPPFFTWHEISWDAESLERTTYAIHEYLGLIWTKLRGQR